MSTAGIIGALIGLIVGYIDFRLVAGFVERRLRATDTSKTPAEKADYESRIVLMRRILFVTTVGFFPVVGYFIGQSIAG